MKLLIVLFAAVFVACEGAGLPMFRIREASPIQFVQRKVRGPEEGCAVPPTWVGKQMAFDESKKAGAFAKISYDALTQRIRIVEETFHEAEKHLMDYLFLFRERTMFALNLTSKQCVKSELKEEFRPMEVPRNASYKGEYYVGSSALPGMGVLVDVYAGEIDNGRYWGTYTREGCIPVSYGYDRKDIGYMHSNFFNVELGVDPEDFEIPKECKA